MKKAISYMACSMAAMLALSACGSAASSTSTVASSSDAASTESTAASEASNEPVTITFAQYSGSGDNEQYPCRVFFFHNGLFSRRHNLIHTLCSFFGSKQHEANQQT